MTVRITPQSVAEHNGVYFVRVIARGQQHDAGDDRYAAIVEASIHAAGVAGKGMRVVLSEYAVEIQVFGPCTVAVAYRLGAQIVKSMKRMMRKLGRKFASGGDEPAGPSAEDVERAVTDWNSRYEAGIDVRYWPGTRDGEPKVGKTTSAAMVLGGHSAVVYISGAGAVALSHIDPPAIAAEPEPTVSP